MAGGKHHCGNIEGAGQMGQTGRWKQWASQGSVDDVDELCL